MQAAAQSQEAAQALGNDHIGSHHLLLGLLAEDGIATLVLTAIGVGPAPTAC
jgi:hypothetical protein